MSDESTALVALLRALQAEREDGPPTSAAQRFGKSVGLAARTGARLLAARLGRKGELDPAALDALVLTLGELKGVAMKVGQTLSYVDTPLPPALRERLALLQRSSFSTPFASVAETLRVELGERAEALLAAMDPTAVASASVGQVHRARLPDGRPVAVKVLHPGIEEAFRADFRGAAVGKSLARLLAPGGNFMPLVEEAQAGFLEECDYRLELERQTRFAALYAQHPDVHIPEAFREWSSARVLTSEWAEGSRLEAFIATGSVEAKARAGRALYDFYVGALYRHGLFNADPHPGNLLFQEDGRVTVLDHGCVREFDRGSVRAFAQLSLAVQRDDVAQMRAALRALGTGNVPEGARFELARTMLRGFFRPLLTAGPHRMSGRVGAELTELVRHKRTLLQLNLPGPRLFLLRIRFGLHSVLERLEAELDWGALERSHAEAALADERR